MSVSTSIVVTNSVMMSVSSTCLSLRTIDSRYTIDISVNKGARNGVLHDGRGRIAGAVVFLTSAQRKALKGLGWNVQGNGPEYSIWSPNKCGGLSSGGWTPSVTRLRTCLSIPAIDNGFGIRRDSSGKALLLYDKGKLAGAVVMTSSSQRAFLTRIHWTYQGRDASIKSIWAPTWCRPLPLDGFKIVVKPSTGSSGTDVCYTIDQLNQSYGVVTSVNDSSDSHVHAVNGRLIDVASGQTIGAVIHTTSDQRTYLAAHGWHLDGTDPNGVRSAYAPKSCLPVHEN